MIEVYSWPTPNGHKVHIMLEECGLAYRVHPVDIGAGDQFAPAFLAISPNNKIPAITDPDGPDGQPLSMFESGAILLYGIPRVVIGENRTFRGEEELLRSRGVELTVVQDARCIEMMERFIREHSDLWAEDIGE